MATIAILTATTYIRRLMREQVCTYMCPWPRIQGAMLDEHSLTVTYNDWRGERRATATPRRRSRPAASRSAIASTAMPASPSARWASTSATASSSNASPARSASMPATASWTQLWARERGLISYATLNDYNHNMALADAPTATGTRSSRAASTPRHRQADRRDQAHFDWRSARSARAPWSIFVGLARHRALSCSPLLALRRRCRSTSCTTAIRST